MRKILTLCLLALLSLNAVAQEQFDDADSVWVEGHVTDATSGLPLPMCELQFLQDGEIRAAAFCDSTGYFTVGWMPMGMYTLSVLSSGKSLYYTDLELQQNAMVNISLVPDTVGVHTLKPTEIHASRIEAVYRPIISADDPRLWNLNGIPIMSDSGPASADLSWPGGIKNPHASKLASWRPAWLDAPFPPKKKVSKKKETKK